MTTESMIDRLVRSVKSAATDNEQLAVLLLVHNKVRQIG